MIEHRLRSLKDVPVPPARADVKARALDAAMTAYATAPPAVSQSGSGPRPFVLRHGYKIAASLAAIAVIGPMLALWRAPPVTLDEAAKSKAPSPPVAIRKEAPGLPPPAPMPAASPGAVTAPAPANAAGTASDAARQSAEAAARPRQSETPAPEAAQPRAMAAPPPPPVASAAPIAPSSAPRPAAPTAMRSAKTARLAASPMLAGLAASLEAGRLPAPSQVEPGALVNAFDYPSGRVTPAPVSIVPAPWSGDPMAFAVVPRPAARAPTLRLELQCGDRAWQWTSPLLASAAAADASAVVSPSAQSPASTTLVGLFAPGAAAGCRASVQARAWIADTPPAASVRAQAFGTLAEAPDDVRFAIAVLRFADLLRGTALNAAAFGFEETVALAEGARGADPAGERAAFVALMRKAAALKK